MREYAILCPQFWTGETGRQIRALGADVQVLALYLLTSPNSNMIGLYYLPLPTLAHETGLDGEQARKALLALEEIRFAFYDRVGETVWIPNMAAFQIGDELKPHDKRVAGVRREFSRYDKSPFAQAFMDRYARRYHLLSPTEGATEAPPSPSEGRSRSRLQEQDQEQEHEQEQGKGGADPILEGAGVKPVQHLITEEPVITLPLADGREAPVFRNEVENWKRLYPAVDVEQQLRNMKGWLEGNKRNRKTREGIGRFIQNWLKDEQNRAPRAAGGKAPDPPAKPVEMIERVLADLSLGANGTGDPKTFPEAWGRVMKHLGAHINPQSYSTWIAPNRVDVKGSQPGVLRLRVPAPEFANMISKYAQPITDAVKELRAPISVLQLACLVPKGGQA